MATQELLTLIMIKNLLNSKVILAFIAFFLLIISPVFAISFGAVDISVADVGATFCRAFGGDCQLNEIKQRIIFELRIPRMLLAFLAGAGLSLAGAVLQMVTRNPLADPYLFGISSGASFGAVLVIAAISGRSFLAEYGLSDGQLSQYSITFGAFLGSAVSVLLVVSLSGAGVQIERMLLSGVAVSFMFSAGTSLVLYSADAQAVASLLFWTLGSFTRASWGNLLIPSIIIIVCLILFLGFSRSLRGVLAGDESAIALGIEVNKLRIGMLLLSSLMTATLVANCGGIGFVGLMIPHIVRRILAKQNQYVLVASVLLGGSFMVWVDVLARTLLENNELPVGVITAAIGSLFFLLVLKKRNWT
jgi:iron complex transport system permease protein